MTSIIDDLQMPDSLPDMTENVHVVQTHISMVFVADAFVYKVKKPVNFGFLDFSTLEKRRYYCHQEVKLNNRLSKGIYLDVLPIRFDGRRHILGQTSGEVVEYAVKMRRIPDAKLMKSLFDKDALTRDHLKKIAGVLARFHRETLRSPEIDQFGSIERFKVNSDENFAQVQKYIGTSIQENVFKTLKGWTEDFYEKFREVFSRRIGQGRIRDCHGDLHMEHVCFTEELSIIDCIEFNDRFRYSDTVADMAFLLMDLEYHDGKDKAKTLWNLYKELAEEEEVDSLLTFYKVYRAFVRGKVNSFQADDENIGADSKEEALERAGKYFELAYSYLG
jgi:aminoglycoside phosphotransferase family enzyme